MVHPDKGRIVCDMDRVGLRWRTNPSGAASEGGPALVWFPRQGRHPTEGGILGGNSSDEQNSFTAKPRIARVLL